MASTIRVSLALKCAAALEFPFCGIADDVMVGYAVVNIIPHADHAPTKHDRLRADLSRGQNGVTFLSLTRLENSHRQPQPFPFMPLLLSLKEARHYLGLWQPCCVEMIV